MKTGETVAIVETRWNYRELAYQPAVSPAIEAWLKKHGHILVDWRWDLKKNGWVRKHAETRCLT